MIHNVFGMQICTNPIADTPKMTLAENVPVTPEFRASINAWMVDFFGIERRIFKIDHPITGGEVVIMSDFTFNKMKAALQDGAPNGEGVPHE